MVLHDIKAATKCANRIAVGNDDCRLALEPLLEKFNDALFGSTIQMRSWLVQQVKIAIEEQASDQVYALPLSGRHPNPALADLRVEAVFELSEPGKQIEI